MKIIQIIKHIYYFFRVKWAIRQFEKTSIELIKIGNVNELRQFAEQVRTLGEKLESSECLKLAERIELNAENIVLARAFNK